MSETQDYARMLFKTNRFTEAAVRQAIRELQIRTGSSGLDLGCGVGSNTLWLGEAVGRYGKVTGLDVAPEFLDLARQTVRQSPHPGIFTFREGDLRELPFADDSFDWLWCKDAFWPGQGLPVEDPKAGLQELARVVRPGGTIALLFWSGQSLLPGYPELEARLGVACTRSIGYLNDVEPDHHFLRALGWMESIGLQNLAAHCFVTSSHGPLDGEMQDIVCSVFDMFFGKLEPLVSAEDWAMVRQLCDPKSRHCLARRPDYYCHLNYTLFVGHNPALNARATRSFPSRAVEIVNPAPA